VPKPGVKTSVDQLAGLVLALKALTDTRLLVGIPRETTDRHDGEEKRPFTNAEIGYVMEFGDAAGKIPPRPHLYPTVRANRAEIVKRLKLAGQYALAGQPKKVLEVHEALGLYLQAEVRKRIRAGIPPPLAESTVRGRIARRKSKTWRAKRTAQVETNLAAGAAPGEGLFTPLIDTANYLGAITYVVRSKLTGQDRSVGPRAAAHKS